MPYQEQSDLDRIGIQNFWGMDSQRDPARNEDYGVGVLSVNQGRRLRRPLEARPGLQPQKSSNSNHTLGGRLFAMTGLPQGGRLVLITRLDGGRLIAVKDVEPDTD